MDLHLIKTTQFYLNNLKINSLTTKLESLTVFNLQNCHLHPLASNLCNVVKNSRTPVFDSWISQCSWSIFEEMVLHLLSKFTRTFDVEPFACGLISHWYIGTTSKPVWNDLSCLWLQNLLSHLSTAQPFNFSRVRCWNPSLSIANGS